MWDSAKKRKRKYIKCGVVGNRHVMCGKQKYAQKIWLPPTPTKPKTQITFFRFLPEQGRELFSVSVWNLDSGG